VAGPEELSVPRRRRLAAATPFVVPGAIAAGALVLGGCNETFATTKGVTAQSHLFFSLWFWMMIAGFAVAIFVWLLIFWSVFAYRKRSDALPKQFREHIGLEMTYTVIPLIIVLVIFGYTFAIENKIDNVLKPPAVIVNVTGYQWGWIFQYSRPTGGVVVQTAPGAAPSALAQSYFDTNLYPQLVLPVDETVRFFLRSHDVIHGFYVHAFDFSRYAQPGVTNEFEIEPTSTGVFPGQCTQYCGLYHSEMLFSVRIVSRSQFQAWFTGELHKKSSSSLSPGDLANTSAPT